MAHVNDIYIYIYICVCVCVYTFQDNYVCMYINICIYMYNVFVCLCQILLSSVNFGHRLAICMNI